MSNIVFCTIKNKELPALARAPMFGEQGKRILETVSKEAWAEWVGMQTILINENRLNLMEPASRDFLNAKLQDFLSGGAIEKPVEFKEVM
ncbi:oxidative damage protection protein [Psychromonas sp. SP041]|uniref:oxidative damage protection protein n=1 Tax=Psychromonas sp. SP041 TaxID=1365007 RepID=UPI0010C7B4A9|nr:oxidative damage protection protein [Psychromonas sp. SP041]